MFFLFKLSFVTPNLCWKELSESINNDDSLIAASTQTGIKLHLIYSEKKRKKKQNKTEHKYEYEFVLSLSGSKGWDVQNGYKS